MRIYIGSAIDTALGAPEEQFKELAEIAKAAFPNQSVVVFNPLTAYINASSADNPADLEYICKLNFQALDQADLALFGYTNSPSFGVPLEIERCAEQNKPFVVWMREGARSGIYLKRAVSQSGTFTSSKEESIAVLRFLGKSFSHG